MGTEFRLDAEYERSLVCILVNDRVAGAGVIVSPGFVLTCAHVVEKPNSGNRLEIKYFGLNTSDQPEQRVEVFLPAFRGDSEGDVDLAVLAYDATQHPSNGVSAARFSSDRPARGTKYRARGFFAYADRMHQPGVGEVEGHGDYKGRSHLNLESRHTEQGFSGSPVYHESTGEVMGLVRGLLKPTNDQRNTSTTCAIPAEVIIRFLIEHNIPGEHEPGQDAISRLQNQIAEILRCDRLVLQKLRDCLPRSVSGSLDSPEKLVSWIIGRNLSLTETINLIRKAFNAIGHQRDQKHSISLANIRKLYVLVISAVLDPDVVKGIAQKLKSGERFLIIPFSSETIAGLILAGAQGRLCDFKKNPSVARGKVGLPKPVNHLEPPVTTGIDHTGDAIRSGMVGILAEFLKIDETTIPAEVRHVALNKLLNRRLSEGNGVFMLVDRQPVALSEVQRSQIAADFSALVLIERRSDERSRDIETDALEPWLGKELEPYWDDEDETSDDT